MLTVSVIKDNGHLVPLTLLVMLLNTTAVPMSLERRIPIRLLLLVVAIGKQFLRQDRLVGLGLLVLLVLLARRDQLVPVGKLFLTAPATQLGLTVLTGISF
tara:strand:- start:666 stop:968 length:303 start_codon:yes stop_codon:yes gene_type:complete